MILLVAMEVNILRLNSAGSVVQTYDVAGQKFMVCIKPYLTILHSGSADFSTANVWQKMDIATSAVISSFNAVRAAAQYSDLELWEKLPQQHSLDIELTPKHAKQPINTQHLCLNSSYCKDNFRSSGQVR